MKVELKCLKFIINTVKTDKFRCTLLASAVRLECCCRCSGDVAKELARANISEAKVEEMLAAYKDFRLPDKNAFQNLMQIYRADNAPNSPSTTDYSSSEGEGDFSRVTITMPGILSKFDEVKKKEVMEKIKKAIFAVLPNLDCQITVTYL